MAGILVMSFVRARSAHGGQVFASGVTVRALSKGGQFHKNGAIVEFSFPNWIGWFRQKPGSSHAPAGARGAGISGEWQKVARAFSAWQAEFAQLVHRLGTADARPHSRKALSFSIWECPSGRLLSSGELSQGPQFNGRVIAGVLPQPCEVTGAVDDKNSVVRSVAGIRLCVVDHSRPREVTFLID
jgi:hypothetical protein